MARFERMLERGQLGESAISRWLQSRGSMVFPAYQIEHATGKGPQLFSASGDCVLPDLLTFKGGSIVWVEAKHKSCFTWHRRSGKWTTGIDLRHYEEYIEVAARTALPVWLMFLHPKAQPDARDIAHGCPRTCQTGLFAGEIFALKDCESHRAEAYDPTRPGAIGHGRSGMVYWTVDVLKRIAAAEDLQGAA